METTVLDFKVEPAPDQKPLPVEMLFGTPLDNEGWIPCVVNTGSTPWDLTFQPGAGIYVRDLVK